MFDVKKPKTSQKFVFFVCLFVLNLKMALMVIQIFYQKEKAVSVVTSEMLFIYEMLLFATVKLSSKKII